MDEIVGVFDVQLPVARIVLAEAAARQFDLAFRRTVDEVVERLRSRSEKGGEIGTVRRKAGEHEAAVVAGTRNRGQPGIGTAQGIGAGITVRLGNAEQAPVSTIDPAMIGAREPVGGTAVGNAHQHTAMQASVAQYADFAILAPDNKQRLSADLGAQEVARLAKLTLMGHEDPGTPEYAFHLHFEDVGIGVDAAMDTAGFDQGFHRGQASHFRAPS